MRLESLRELLLERKQQLMAVFCCLLAFLVGYGSGQAGSGPRVRSAGSPSNYSTNQEAKPNAEGAEMPAGPTSVKAASKPVAKVPATKNVVSGACPIKGNVSGSKKIYHVPGGAFYNTVSPEQCFNTEAQAQSAGFQKSKR